MPKYKIGDTVWFIAYDKVHHDTITAIQSVAGGKWSYSCGKESEFSRISLRGINHDFLPEERYFTSKEELIASL